MSAAIPSRDGAAPTAGPAGAERAARTPAHTLDALRAAIAKQQLDKRTGAAFVNIDTRVLEWLIADSAALAQADPAPDRASPAP